MLHLRVSDFIVFLVIVIISIQSWALSKEDEPLVFDASFYLGYHQDLIRAFGPENYEAAYNHWLTYGKKEGRRSSFYFDPKFYLESHADLKRAYGKNYEAAFEHWVAFGLSEGRRSSPDFDVKFYLNRHADLVRHYGQGNFKGALQHFRAFGVEEGRQPAEHYNVNLYKWNRVKYLAEDYPDNALPTVTTRSAHIVVPIVQGIVAGLAVETIMGIRQFTMDWIKANDKLEELRRKKEEERVREEYWRREEERERERRDSLRQPQEYGDPGGSPERRRRLEDIRNTA